ncbi:translesion DNA synthesis-associated protein ImuA [Pusillimonas sp. TS35]|nr:translesion DNA synthesis-associated protein ImuA [Pusillimonas sp. TS35]
MAQTAPVHSPAALRHPERIHPALWRGSQLARPPGAAVSTGFGALDKQLPGAGWPLGSLVELLPDRPGQGELSLLQPALARLPGERGIYLLAPPCTPYFHCWSNWGLGGRQIIWITPASMADTLWAAEQILRHNAGAALLCWAGPLRPAALRRLHLAARQSDTLFIMARPPTAAEQASAAPLRLALAPAAHGLDIRILKRPGPACAVTISLALYPARAASTAPVLHHAALDQSLPLHAQPGRQFSELVG